jgi:branched-chain amino acid transport system substrate-binding protein
MIPRQGAGAGCGVSARLSSKPREASMRKVFWPVLAAAASFVIAGGANAQIKLGVAGPLTGSNAAFGAQLKNGAEQAVADINAKGGINGQKIELSFGDDAAKPEQGVSVANKFVGDKIQFVVGHFNSGVTMPASDVYAENGIFMITPSATNPTITTRGLWNVFRTCGDDDNQGQTAAKYIADKFKGKNIAIVHDKTTYGKGLADFARKYGKEYGIKEVLYEGINIGEKDFAALVTKIKAANADLVYWGGLHTEGGLIVRQMRDQGIKAPLMGGDGIASDEFAAIGGPGVEGTLMTFGPDPRKHPEAKAVVAKFIAKQFNPEAYTLYSYAAVEVIDQAATAIKSLDPKKVAAEVRTGKTYKTVIGDLKYDKKGDITRPDYVVYTWKKGADGKITYTTD